MRKPLVLSLLALLGVLEAGCQKSQEPPRLPLVVKTQTVALSTPEAQTTRYSGVVQANTQINLAFKVGGYVDQVLQMPGTGKATRPIQAGDPIAQGAMLARVRQADYIPQVQQAIAQHDVAQATVGQARAQAQQAVSTRQQAGSRVEEARAGLLQAQAQRDEAAIGVPAAQAQFSEAQAGRDQAKAQVQEAQASYAQAQEAYTRAKTLYESGSLTRPDYETAQTQYQVAQARAQAAFEQLRAAEDRIKAASDQVEASRSRLTRAEAAVLAAQATIKTAQEQVTGSQATVAQAHAGIAQGQAQTRGAQAQIAVAKITLSDTELRSPLAGTLLQRNVDVGTLVSPGTVAFVVADTRTVKVAVGVSDRDVNALHIGNEVNITTDSVPGVTFIGHVTTIAPAADARSHVFNVEASVPNPQNRLKIGMVALLQWKSGHEAAPAPLVPALAIVHSPTAPGTFAVFVAEHQGAQTVAHLRNVVLGQTSGNSIELTSGVHAGDEVITTGSALVHEGEVVRVSP